MNKCLLSIAITIMFCAQQCFMMERHMGELPQELQLMIAAEGSAFDYRVPVNSITEVITQFKSQDVPNEGIKSYIEDLAQSVQLFFCPQALALSCKFFEYEKKQNVAPNRFYGHGAHEERIINFFLRPQELSDDEKALASLYGISCKSCFMSSDENNPSQSDGFIAGIVAPCLNKKGCGEWQYMVITPEQNTFANGYGNIGSTENGLLELWAEFYDISNFPSWQEVVLYNYLAKRLTLLTDTDGQTIGYFNNAIYEWRIGKSMREILWNANKKGEMEDKATGEKVNKDIYLYIIPFCLSINGCAIDTFSYATFMMNICKNIIKDGHCERIKVIDLGGNDSTFVGCEYKGTQFVASGRKPFDKLPEEHHDKILFVVYQWDGSLEPTAQSFQNNSSDVATVSLVRSLQNHTINPYVIPCILKEILIKNEHRILANANYARGSTELHYAGRDMIQSILKDKKDPFYWQVISCWFNLFGKSKDGSLVVHKTHKYGAEFIGKRVGGNIPKPGPRPRTLKYEPHITEGRRVIEEEKIMTVIEEKIVSMNALPSSAALKPNDNKVMPFDEQTIDVNWLKDFPEKLQNPEKKTGKLLFWGVGGVCGALFMWLCYKGYLTISFPSFYSLTRVRF